MSDDVTEAFLATAKHFDVQPHEVSREQIREARKLGVHSVSERDIGSHTKARIPLLPVPQGHHVRGVSTLVDAEGNTKGQWIKTSKDRETREEILERLVSGMPSKVPARTGAIVPPIPARDSDLLAVYPMGDPHLGMLSWAPETGQNFDLDIAERLTKGAIDNLVGSKPMAATGLILNLGDFFHSDTKHNTTTKGTPVDVDGRMFKILKVGRDLMIHCIDAALRMHEHVVVDNRLGNHDKVTSMFLSLALDAYYRNEPRVKINVSSSAFFYFRFGCNLIGTTHGDTVKMNELQKIMSVDRRQDWGEVDHAFWYCGHVHHTSRTEDYGCVIETFRTLASRDEWHHAKGYRSSRDMNRIVLHKQLGEVSRTLITAAALEAEYRQETYG